MSNEAFETLLRLVFPPERYPNIYSKLSGFKRFDAGKKRFVDFEKSCVDTGESMERHCRESDVLRGSWKGVSYARWVGFFRNVGLPFASRCDGKGNRYYTGHAQVGARLIYLRFRGEIPERTLLTMAAAIESRACHLRPKNSSSNKLRADTILRMYFPTPESLPVAECLQRAIDPEAQSFSLPVPYRKSDRVVVFLFGPRGRTSAAAKLLESILVVYGSVFRLEGDDILMQCASEGESYDECRRRVCARSESRNAFRSRWKLALESAGDCRILLVDSFENVYYTRPDHFRHRFRIGLYCFPTDDDGGPLEDLNDDDSFLPDGSEGYPRTATESGNDGPFRLEVSTGIWQTIPILVGRYLSACSVLPLRAQPFLASLCNRHGGIEGIASLYDPGELRVRKRYSFDDCDIFEVNGGRTNRGGCATHYHREEYLLKVGERVFALRSGLPALNDAEEEDRRRFRCILATPKFDGVSVNVVRIPREFPHYELLRKHFPESHSARYDCLFFVGCKKNLAMKKATRRRFDLAIRRDFETFMGEYAHYFDRVPVTFHFELMDEGRRKVVYYPANFVKFIGSTTFTNTERSFRLSEKSDPRSINRYAFRTWSECKRYVEKRHRQLVMGDESVQPEGFVLYAFDRRGLKDIVRNVFEEYSAIANPKQFETVYHSVLNNMLLLDRFRKAPSVKDEYGRKWTKHRLMSAIEYDVKHYWKTRNETEKAWQFHLNCITTSLCIKPIDLSLGLMRLRKDRTNSKRGIRDLFKPILRCYEKL